MTIYDIDKSKNIINVLTDIPQIYNIWYYLKIKLISKILNNSARNYPKCTGALMTEDPEKVFQLTKKKLSSTKY